MVTPNLNETPIVRFELPPSLMGKWGRRASGDAATPRAIELLTDRLLIPTGWDGQRREVPLEHLTGLRVVRELRRDLLTIETGTHTWNFSLGRRIDGDKARALVSEARTRCAALPNGDLTTVHIDARESAVAEALRHGARAIYVFVALLVVAYAARLWRAHDIFDLDYFGAMTRALVIHGEIYRLVTAEWLHGGRWHLIGNAVAIVWFGAAVERFVGVARLVVIITVAAIGASLGSMWLTPAHSIGASGIGMGLGASFAVIALVYGRALPRPLARPAWWWAVFALLLLPSPHPVYGALVDHAAHAGGTFAGGFVTWLLVRDRMLSRTKTCSFVGLAAACLVIHVVCMVVMAARVAGVDELAEMARLERFVRDRILGADDANAIAWRVAIDAKATPRALTAALRLAESALDVGSRDLGLADTAATLHHRLGGDQRAAELEARALDLASRIVESETFATQLARFLSTQPGTAGITIATDDREVHIAFDTPERAATAMTLYAVAYKHGNMQGLLRLNLPGGATERRIPITKVSLDDNVWAKLGAPLGDDITYGNLLVRNGCDCREASGAAWPIDPEVLTWP